MAAIGSLVSDLDAEELGGAMVRMKRRWLVTDLTIKGPGVLNEALAHPDVPQPGTTLGSFPNLVATRRIPKVDPNDPSKVWVDIEYEQRQKAVFNQEDYEFRVTGGTSLQQIQSAYDGYGNQITVSHTFPADDPDYPSETREQGGEISVLSPQTTLTFEGVLRTPYPHYISSNTVNYLNMYYWAGGAQGTWLCADVGFTLHDSQNNGVYSSLDALIPLWKFSFTFLYKPEGHQPYVFYNDPRENRTPPDLVAGTGYKQITWYPYGDFGLIFPL